MLPTTKAVVGLLLAATGALAQNPTITAAPACGGDNPCAAQVSAVPTCATGCIESVASQLGCVHGDYSCHCAKSQAIQETGISCVLDACGLEALNVIPAVGSLCSCVTANPTSPCTSQPGTTTTSEPPVITDPPTCGGNPCSEYVSAVPACATGCIESAASQVGCGHGDYSCQCASSMAIQETAIVCVVNGCGDEALNVIGAVGNMCSCVTANPTTPCPESTSTSKVDVTTTTTTTTKTTPTPACPTNECSFPNPADHECVAGCIDAVLPEFGCSALEDWNCYCNNFRRISSRAFQCAWGCSPALYNAFNGPASQGCTCLLEECENPSSSSSASSSSSSSSSSAQSTATTTTPEPPTSTSTSASSTITTPPECPHPCAASISAVPACATACITSAASNVGCGSGDYDCRCSSSSAIQVSAVNCVIGACGLNEALKVADAVGSLCSCVTASPTTPCDATSTTTSSILTTTTSSSVPATTTTTKTETSSSSEPCTSGGSETGTGTGSAQPSSTSSRTSTSKGGGGTTSSGDGGNGEETPCPSSSFATETRTVTTTTSVCDDDDEAGTGSVSATRPPTSTCTAGCGGSGGGDDGEEGGSGGGGGSGPGGDNGGGSGGGSGGGGSNTSPTKPAGGGSGSASSTTTLKPPVATAGASGSFLIGTGCLAGVVAIFVALL